MIDTLGTWARQYGIGEAAITDLRRRLGFYPEPVQAEAGASESAVNSRILLRAHELGFTLWRNNSGAMKTEHGMTRFGLGHESEKTIKKYASHDYIGWRRTLIEQRHVGLYVPVFASVEGKRANWKWTGSEHEIAQANWGGMVIADGGYAVMINDPARLKWDF